VVRVLELVHQHVLEAVAVVLEDVFVEIEELHRPHDEIVEVERARLFEPPLIVLIDLRHGALPRVGGKVSEDARRDETILGIRYRRRHRARGIALRVEVQLREAGLDQALGVGCVVDREGRPDPEPGRLASQDPDAGGVEGRHPHAFAHRAHELDHPALHLARRLVGEGDRQDGVGRHPGGNEVGDPVGQHPRLSRPGAGDDERRAPGVLHRVPLDRVERREVDCRHGSIMCAACDSDRLAGNRVRRSRAVG
jgi:hypothetical protein